MSKILLPLLFFFGWVTGVSAQPPTLGTYPSTTIATAGRNALVTPSAVPTNAGTIHATTSPVFKGLLSVNPSTGVVTITNAQPAGTYTVVVKSFNGVLTALSSFTLVVNNTFCSQGLFANTISVPIASSASSVAIADFNGDGKQDFVSANSSGGTLSIRLGDGAGNFTGATNISVGNSPGAVVAGDFNGDGNQDIAVLFYNTVAVLSGNGTGGFGLPVSVSAESNPSAIAIADFNSDGKPDLAIANAGSNNISIRLGNGAGGFTNAASVSVGSYPQMLVITDFNNDGKADLATSNYTSNNVSIRFGDGAGGFTGTTNITESTQFIVTADFNSDGNQDFITANANGNLSLKSGDGTGSFSTIISTVTVPNSSAVVTGDFNGDGKPDIAFANRSSNSISIRLGNGAGNFTSTPDIIGTGYMNFVTNGDFNSDGRQDILSTNSGTAVLVHLGNANLAEINIRGNGVSITDGDATPATADFTDFGNVGSSLTRTFVIQNTGTGSLPVNNIVIRGVDSAMFTAGGITLPAVIAAATSDTFTVSFTPTSTGVKTAFVTIDNNDCNEKIYDFAIQGNGVASTVSIGTYAPTSITVGTDTTIAPSVVPANAVSITALAPAHFKGLLQVDPITGVVTITNAHPAGTYPVSMKAFNGFSTATTSFVLTVNTNTGCNKGLFITAPNVAVGVKPFAITVGDFNKDGLQDIATANNAGNTVSVKLGNGTGGFTTGATVATGIAPWSLAIADFNGDGKPDMAVANNISNSVSIRLGNGAGNFSGATEVPVGNRPQSIAIGDFNGDGRQDFAVTNYNSNTVSVRFGDGAGGFYGTTEIGVGAFPHTVAVADFNNDDNLDFAVSNSNSTAVSIRLGTGTGSFNNAPDVTVGTGPQSLVIADFNSDGNQDFSVVNSFTGSVSIRLGNGMGAFTAVTGFTVPGNRINYVVAGDFNTDGKPDLAVAELLTSVVAIRLGTGNGSFIAAASVPVGNDTYSIAIGDFNGDGRQDFATADTTGSNVSVRLGSVNEMTLTGNGTTITDGDTTPDTADFTDFGNVSSVKRFNYIIQNDGPANLTISSIVLSGTDAAMFRIDSISFPATIAAGAADTFNIRFVPTSAGVKSATVTINNDDCDESVYDFAIQGTGIFSVPTLGTYPDTTMVSAGGNGAITPSAIPGDAVSTIAYATPKFKGTLLINPQTGVLNITNAQPEGSYPVTVRTFNGFSTTITSFILVVSSSNCSQSQFIAGANVPVSGTQTSLTIADFNGDGNQDIASANPDNSSVSIRLGNGLGGFTAAGDVTTSLGPASVVTGDFNGDGKADIATASSSTNTIAIRLGNGSGGFIDAPSVAAGGSPNTIVTGDFNGDGKLDLAVTNNTSNTVSVRLGNGEGRFTGTLNVAVGTQPGTIIIADFNGDGKTDFATANNAVTTASIRLGDGSGNFTAAPDVTTGSNVFSIAAGDFNGDGNQDLALANAYSNTISIRLGNGTGSFSGALNISVPAGPYALAVGDFNGDGKQDIAAALSVNSVIVLPGNGAGSFTVPTTQVSVGSYPRSLVVGDFNNDGRMDLATGNYNNFVSVRLGTTNDINVKGNNTDIADGDNTPGLSNYTSFGTVATGNMLTRTFTIQNAGNGNLVVNSISVTGADSALFSRAGITLPATIAAGASATFTITFTATGNGVKTARVNISNNDCDESVYDFAIRGAASCTPSSTTNLWLGTTANWSVASNWSLGFVPTECTKVVVNSGVPFMPEIISPASTCYSLTLNNGATVTIKTGGHLNITANN